MTEALVAAAVPGHMPERLAEYWVHGKGALKIRWGTPGDFKRCVRNLRKYFPTNPEGLCNRLHTRALGVPPGQEHALDGLEPGGVFRNVSTEERKRLAEKGHAMPDGSYPIETEADLANAIQAVGRAKPSDRAAVRRHIIKRARALGAEDKIPEAWLKRSALEASQFAYYDEMAEDDLFDETLYEEEAALVPMKRMWRGRLAPIGAPTGDRRRFAEGGISHRDLPLALLYQKMTGEGHSSSVVVGRILAVDVRPDEAYGWGDWFDTDDARDAQALTDSGVGGPSVDLDDIEYELRVPGTDQQWLANEQCSADTGECSVHEFVVTKGRISAATIVAIPAFAEAKLETYDAPDEEGLLAAFDAMPMAVEDDSSCGCGMAASAIEAYCVPAPALTAAVATTFAPPGAAFTDPGFTEFAEAIRLDEHKFPGYVAIYGHVAPWRLPHVGVRQEAPRSRSGYAYFHVGEVYTAEGDSLAVGKIVYAGKHPSLDVGLRAAVQHYDDTSKAVAVVRAGEDRFGIWVAGVLLPWVDDHTKLDLGLSPLSGDWRRVGGAYEMIAALAVNFPGFPVVRERMEEGRGVALVACAGTYGMLEDPGEWRILRAEAGRLVVRDGGGKEYRLAYEPVPVEPPPVDRVAELYALFGAGKED